MSAERLPELFAEALELDEPGRRELIDRLQTTEPALAAELARLLAAPAGAPSPIDGSPLAAAGLDAGRPEPPPPQRIGPYRIVRELGRGGMGRVFLAEQETPDFRRPVALKLIDRPGPDDEAVRRFRAEVRILASLDHPGIVRFLDGGRSPEGTWFIALEYLEGDDLLTHARQAALDVPARVRLFLAVTEAVAFAHACDVVHRDLKPANVLVDRDGRPRLLDFGISRLLSPAGSASSVAAATRTDMQPLTPAYASPEQLAGEPATPASDVYSLGVVFHELLAGRRPLAAAPSSRPALATGAEVSGPETPSAARRRRSTASGRRGRATGAARAARGRLGRDLDAICLRALQVDPAARYPHAGALADDLRRCLDGRPIAVRRRARLLAAGAAAALAALLAFAVAVSRWQAPPEAPAALAAPARPGLFPFDPVDPPPAEESERRFAEAPDDLVAGSALACRLVRDGRTEEARIVLGRLRQVPGGADDPLVDFIAGELANRAGETQGALVFFTRARDNALAQGRSELLGTIRLRRGAALTALGQVDAALAELERARSDLARAGDHRQLYSALNDLAVLHCQRGDLDAGEAMYEQALESARIAGFDPAIALANLADVKLLRGRPDLAEPPAREALERFRRNGHPAGVAMGLVKLSQVVRDLGRAAEADAHLDEALSVARIWPALQAQAFADLEKGRLDRIDALVSELEAAADTMLQRRPLAAARSVGALEAALAGDLAAARESFADSRRLFRSEGVLDLAALSDLAWAEAEAAAGDPAAAARILDQALAGLDHAAASQPGFSAELLRVRIDAESGRLPEARRRLESLGEEPARSPSVSRRLAFLRARAALAAAERRPEAARADLEAAIAAARRARRTVEELELRLDLAAVAADLAAAARLASDVEREAAALGLAGLAQRARAAAANAA